MATKTKHSPQTVDLRKIFLGLQKQMLTELATAKTALRHPVAKGDSGELRWLKMLREYLPERYCAERAFVLDSNGTLSQQMDVVIYDRQYSPFLFNQGGTKYISAESVYAVFEVRPTLTPANIRYAAEKARSVRTLHRTSAPIPHAGGIYKPKTRPRIIAGLLATTQSTSNTTMGAELTKLEAHSALDLLCALDSANHVVTRKGSKTKVKSYPAHTALISFFLSLLRSLQESGTVPAIEIAQYAKNL